MGLYKYAYTGKNWNNANITGEVMCISTDGKERMRFLDRGQIEVNRTTQPYTDLRNQFSVYASNTELKTAEYMLYPMAARVLESL